MSNTIYIVGALLIAAASLVYTSKRRSECGSDGGVLVRGVWGLECVQIKEVKK